MKRLTAEEKRKALAHIAQMRGSATVNDPKRLRQALEAEFRLEFGAPADALMNPAPEVSE